MYLPAAALWPVWNEIIVIKLDYEFFYVHRIPNGVPADAESPPCAASPVKRPPRPWYSRK